MICECCNEEIKNDSQFCPYCKKEQTINPVFISWEDLKQHMDSYGLKSSSVTCKRPDGVFELLKNEAGPYTNIKNDLKK